MTHEKVSNESVLHLTPEEVERVRELDGLYVGVLTQDELALFDVAVAQGLARRFYDGVGGFLGCAKVDFLQ